MTIKQCNNITIIISISIVIVFLFTTNPAKATTSEKNLLVPFTPQAPYAYWGQPWQDACEETSVVMVDNYYRNKPIDSPAIAKAEIEKILELKNKKFGWSLDESASKIVELINDFLPWEARIVENPTLEQIKNEIDENRPIIIPAHGKYLYNPHFRNGGPDYHMLVISGYNDETQEFITQEPGTRHGKDFRYSYKTIMNAIHDLLPPSNTKNGPVRAIFTQRELITSANFDGDADGLKKTDEIKNGTITWLYDSDGDGYSDGEEVNSGYSPTMAEINIKNGSLIKAETDPKVYLLENKTKRHIVNEQVFLNHGWKWVDIKIVSEKFLESLTTGQQISN